MTVMSTYARSDANDRVVLKDLLIEPIEDAGRVAYGKAFQQCSINQDYNSNEKVKVHFKDGTSDVCDILIGADGSGLKISAQLGARNSVPLNTHFSFVSKSSLPLDRLKQLPQRLLQAPVIVFKRNVSFYYALYLPSNVGPETNNSDQEGECDSGVDRNKRSANFR
jgi:hypothetical protein